MRDDTGATDTARRMATAARAFLDALSPDQRSRAHASFDSPDRAEFTYLPGPRPGLALGEMSSEQHGRAMELLATGLSVRGFGDAQAIMRLEEILAGIERAVGKRGWERRNPVYYWFRVLGDPGGDGPWMWKVGGHHLCVHMTVVGDLVAGTPQFFGANPATVPSGHEQAGKRTLAEEEDLARWLVSALDPDRREAAVSAALAPQDILTRRDPVADADRIPPGLLFADMAAEHQATMVRLVRHYLGRATPAAAEPAWAAIERAGLDRVSFRWAGPIERGHGHYYAVLGPTFLLEYDNTQNHANHIHTVWRDLNNDWGEDLLAAHYAAHRH